MVCIIQTTASSTKSVIYRLADRFPYLLPNVVGATLALIALPMVFFFLHETNPPNGSLRRGMENDKGYVRLACRAYKNVRIFCFADCPCGKNHGNAE